MKRCPKYAYIAVFAVFYLFLLMQFGKVFIYYDDYGYLSLSYGTNIPVAGADYGFSDLLAFIKGHYVNSNGRLLYMFLYCFVHMIGGIRGVQVFMATAVLAVLVMIFLTVQKMLEGSLSAGEVCGEEQQGKSAGLTPFGKILLAAFLCLLYGTLGIMLQRMGTYWYAASFIYVVPAITFLGFALCFYRTALYGPGEKPGLIRAGACVLLGFLAAWSQEQWFVTTVSFAVICLVYKFLRNRRLRIYDGLTFAACAAGGLIIILSPAVSARMNSGGNAAFASLSFFGKLGRNIPLLMNLFFSGDNLRYLLFFFPVMILLGLVMARQAGGRGRAGAALHLAFSGISAAVFAGYLMKQKLSVFPPGNYSGAAANLLLIYIAFYFVEVILFYRKENQPFGAFVFSAAVLSVGSAAIVPEVPLRIFYPFLYLSWLLFAYLYGKALLREAGRLPVVSLAALLYLSAVSIPNLRNIYQGYRSNYEVLMYDDAVFKESARAIKNGADIDSIEVYELPDLLCKNEVVYDENFSFMIVWMREYYDLPEDVEFDYRPFPGMEAFRSQTRP